MGAGRDKLLVTKTTWSDCFFIKQEISTTVRFFLQRIAESISALLVIESISKRAVFSICSADVATLIVAASFNSIVL